ncbi:MAG: hypothetical protein IAE94_06840 [Chthoniobacterales bacterium]|nr:hypothetical protein [Chthoniobacterales bacterium]
MKIAHFTQDITPPLGHPLCAGWYPAATAVSERLSAHGVIIEPEDGTSPMVLCALDWAELSNFEHRRWCEAIAGAVGTTPERVAVHCLHNHDAPWPDEEAQALLDEQGRPEVIMQTAWCRDIRAAVARAAGRAAERLEPVDRLRFGRARVSELACNRRPIGADGKVVGVRWTRCLDAEIRALPEGTIDPWLQTVSFWQGTRKLAALHYYAIHPTSYDGTGIVTTDFAGIARDRLIAEEGVPHVYFTGCGGNITAGKYNDGVADNRALFAGKIFDAMREAERQAGDSPVPELEWRTAPVRLPGREDVTDEQLMTAIRAAREHPKQASRAALELTYRHRVETPITVSALHFGKGAALLHLPGEAFIEYQLFAQELLHDTWMGVAAYGDLGPGYICLERSFAEGGYEPRDAFCAPESEHALKQAIRDVLTP